MAKKTTKTAEKAAPKKKPVTNAEMFEYLKVVRSNILARINDVEDNVEAALKKIESKVSDDAAFRMFVQSLVKEQQEHAQQLQDMKEIGEKWDAEEQGLEPGDYTDASKEVADELTAMGYGWWHDNFEDTTITCIAWGGDRWHHLHNLMFRTMGCDGIYYHRPEFLSRARVTAKRLRLVPVEPKPWKPEVGGYATCVDAGQTGGQLSDGTTYEIQKVGDVDITVRRLDGNLGSYFKNRFRPATPEEVAKHKEEQELAKPILPYETRVMWEGDECTVLHGPDVQGYYLLHALGTAETITAKRHEFTVLA